MDTLVIHDEDFDGWGARYAAWKHFGNEAKYLAIDHGKWQEQVPWDFIPDEPTEIYLLDYSWPLDELFELSSVHDLTVIDHHESFLDRIINHDRAATPDYEKNFAGGSFQGQVGRFMAGDQFSPTDQFTLCFDENNSAAVLAWRYFHQTEAPKLLKHIEDRDLWRWEMKHTDEILLALDSKEQSVSVYDQFARMPERLIQAGTAIATYRDKMVSRLVKKTTIREAEVDGNTYTFGIVNSPLLQSKIGEKVREEYPEVDVALIFFLEDLARGAIVGASLRSGDEDPSVGDLAQVLGGGGHDNAAGFSTILEDLTLEDTPQQLVRLD